MRYFFFFLTVCFLSNASFGQREVQFPAADGLQVTADVYYKATGLPYIVLCHQQGSSRGEYREIAKKLMNLGYNCLAVDLRSGDASHYIRNKTAEMADNMGLQPGLYECTKDIRAALRYAYEKSKLPVVLFGSGFSASLCLMEARQNQKVKAVVAFEPGEFFLPDIQVKESLKAFDKPVFLGARTENQNYINEMIAFIPTEMVTICTNKVGPGYYGALSLQDANPSSDDFWLNLLLFFSRINKSGN